jgi:hypothetical protein
VPEQGVPERVVQAVGFGVEQGIQEAPALRLFRLVQVDPDVPKAAFELGQQQRQRVLAAAGAAHSHIFRPVGPYDQDACPGVAQALAQVKEQSAGGEIDPVQIVQDQEQRLLRRQHSQHVAVLLVDAALLRALAIGLRGPARHLFL